MSVVRGLYDMVFLYNKTAVHIVIPITERYNLTKYCCAARDYTV